MIKVKVTRAKTSTLNDRLGLFGLQTNVELKMLNVAVQFLSSVGHLRVRIPLQESCVGY